MQNEELIKALRCKEYFDLCKDASCKYHVNGMRSGCRCEIKVKEHAAADALEAADKRVKELEAAQRWIPVGERPPEGYEDEEEVLTFDEHGNVEGFPASHIPIWNGHHPTHKITHWRPLPQPPQKGE